MQRYKQKTIVASQLPEKEPSLKILAIFFHPKTSVTAIGGAEKRFIETMKFFCRKHNLEINVLEAAPSLLEETKIRCNKELVSINFRGSGWTDTYLEWFFWIFKAFFKGVSFVRKVKPHVIFVPNNTQPNLVLSCLISAASRTPICAIVHHIDTPFSKPNSNNCSLYSSYRSIKYGKIASLIKTIATYMTFPLLKRAKAIIAVSKSTAEALRRNKILKTEIMVSGNAINIGRTEETRSSFDEKAFDGVFVGRIAKEKGVFDLLKVWKNVVKAKKDARLLIIGSGLEEGSVKKKIARMGLEEKVVLKGKCSDTELYKLLKSSRLFIFPSVFEGWGIAVAEALACGLPVAAYDIPALREIFGKCDSVFLTPIRNIERMSSTVLDILNSNENEMLELSYCSIAYPKRFRWDEIAEKDIELLKNFWRT